VTELGASIVADDPRNTALIETLALAVPMWIWQLRDRTPAQRAAIGRRCAQEIASHGDTLMFGGKKGAPAQVFNHLAEGLAAAAYQPGGVTFAGRHWCTDHAACKAADAEVAASPGLHERAEEQPPSIRRIEDVPMAGGLL
jgi:hypothetical protein